MMDEIDREALIAKLSWWAGVCQDNEVALSGLTDLACDLLDVKHLLTMDRPNDGLG